VILAISSRTDEHTKVVIAELSRIGASAALLDLSEFPQAMRLAMRYDEGDRSFQLRLAGGAVVRLSECRSIWWRRPQAFVPHPEVLRPGDLNFIQSESHEAFAGLWQAVDAFWINHPTRDQVASHKAHQLRVAQQVGLCIPSTLITNDPEEARAFVAARGQDHTIYKAFSATAQDWRETRLLRPGEVSLLDRVRYAPVIFQEYVAARLDLRVTVVGSNVFPAAIYSQETSYKVDFRMDMANARVEPWPLPPDVESRLHAFMSALGLVYGAIDMRLTEDGRYVFLEVNPAGQWLFVEERSGQPITAAISRLLAEREHLEPATASDL
jgi:glutathione synthase/RimK-type ligase-like ATP-grasp enzyme